MPSLAHGRSRAPARSGWALTVVASLVAMLNAVRYAANKTALGFINPLLYANPHAFLDVTAGKDNGFNALQVSVFVPELHHVEAEVVAQRMDHVHVAV